MILTLFGMWWRIMEINMLENAVTSVTATFRGDRRVLAVGTTVVRALESYAATGEAAGATSLFIRDGHPWALVDRLLTNFHVPRSSLLALVRAFAGPRWRDLYAAALADGYRFLSFGDAMLLERSPGATGGAGPWS